MGIDAWARVDENARIGEGVTIGPFAQIGPDVEIGDGCEIASGAIVCGHTTLGRENILHPHCVIGGPPQDLKYAGEPTKLLIGDRNNIREGVTMNVGTVGGGGITRVGDECLILANAHVAHDCQVGNEVILSNNVLLAGHTEVQSQAILNGGSAVHHFTIIGRLCYLGGLTPIPHDIPPFLIAAGQPLRYGGINVVGMRRRGFSEETILAVRAMYKRMFRTDEPVADVIKDFRGSGDPAPPEVAEFVEFVAAMEAGHHGRSLEAMRQKS